MKSRPRWKESWAGVASLAAALLVAACSSQPTAQTSPSPSASPTVSATATPSPSPGGETPVDKRVLPPATDAPVANLCSAPIQQTVDGNAVPLLCRSGALNVQAWQYYSSISASILGLGLNPTEGQVESAICDDLTHNHATKSEENSGYKLASTYYGWAFGLDPGKVTCT